MEIRYNVEKEARKALVQAIGEIVGWAPVYKKAPGFEYVVHNYTIDRFGTLIYDERVDEADARHLLAELAVRGFEREGFEHEELDSDAEAVLNAPASSDSVSSVDAVIDEVVTEATATTITEPAVSATVDTPDTLAIEIPFEGFRQQSFENLQRLVAGKATLIMKAIGVDALPIERREASLCFPWFSAPASGAEVDAYTRFIHALCEMAKNQKRVTMKEKTQDGSSSEKFAFRCFLLRLGFIGEEYASARKVLLSKLSGNGSFKNGDHKDRVAVNSATCVGVNYQNTGSEVSVL